MSKTYRKMQVKCAKCGKLGTLTLKSSYTRGVKRQYYYIQHTDLKTYKKNWCYLGKFSQLPSEYQALIHNKEEVIHNTHTQKSKNYTQSNNPKNKRKFQNTHNSIPSYSGFLDLYDLPKSSLYNLLRLFHYDLFLFNIYCLFGFTLNGTFFIFY